MTAQIGKISLKGIYHDDSAYTFLLASGITTADIGKAVTIDSTAANTIKLAGNQEVILGRLESVEERTAEGITVGTIICAGSFEFFIDTDATASPDQTPAVGDFITGAALSGGAKGYVQKSLNNVAQNWQVVELVSATKLIAIKL